MVSFSDFAASNPVPGLNDGTLSLAFQDLRQVDIFATEYYVITWNSMLSHIAVQLAITQQVVKLESFWYTIILMLEQSSGIPKVD